jgi:hypothetical protein
MNEPEKSSEQSMQHLEWVSEQVALLFLALGYALTPERQVLFAQALADVPKSSLETAFSAAVRQLSFEPRPADIRKLAGLAPEQQELGEAHKAWDLVCAFADKWVAADHEGVFRMHQGVRSEPIPTLSQRILDVVRRTGGWEPYKWRTTKSLPFLERDFLQEYKVWTYAEFVDESKMLTPGEVLKQLKAPVPLKSMPAPESPRPQKLQEPLTEAQLVDRREILRQQAQRLKERHA